MKRLCLDFCFWEAGSLVYRKQELRKFPLSSGIQAKNGQMEDALKGALNSTAFDKAHDFQASLHFDFLDEYRSLLRQECFLIVSALSGMMCPPHWACRSLSAVLSPILSSS